MRRPPSRHRREQLLDSSPSDVFPEERDSGEDGGDSLRGNVVATRRADGGDGARRQGSSGNVVATDTGRRQGFVATRRLGAGSLRTLPSSVTITGGVRDRLRPPRSAPWSHRPLALARGESGLSASPYK